MVEMELSKIKIDEKRSEQVIVLKEKEGTRYLPVVIGVSEVNAIKLKLSGIQLPRPLTHDLLLSLIEKLHGNLKSVIIDNLEDNTFFAKIVILDSDEKEIWVDARPSDSIALALRAEVPIFVEEVVLNEASISENGDLPNFPTQGDS